MFVNSQGIREITEDDAYELNIDTSMIKACKKIRNIAKLDRLSIDETVHRSGLNKHLFNYIEYLGFKPLDFVKEYLSNLQPFMIERKKDQEKEKSFICVIDNLYKISIYIKVDTKNQEELIISFHEDNIRGIAKDNSALIKIVDNENLVPVFADSIGSINNENGNVSVKVFMQRGVKVLPLSVVGFKYKDTFIVRKGDLDRQFIDYCNEYIRELYTSNLELDFNKIEVFSMLQQISFTSYGRDTFSSISLLIDSLTHQTDYNSKSAADFALVTFVSSLNLTDEQKVDLANLLDEKYKVTSIKSIDEILYRVKGALMYDGKTDLFPELNAIANDLDETGVDHTDN